MATQGLSELKQLINNLKKLRDKGLSDLVDGFIQKNKRLLLGYNISNLRNLGEGSDGKELVYLKSRKSKLNFSRAYVKAYANLRRRRNLQSVYIDLRVTGGFHRSIDLIKYETGWWIFVSMHPNYKYLAARYGKNILGVTEKQLDLLIHYGLLPYLEDQVAKKLKIAA